MSKLILSEEIDERRKLNESFSPSMPDWLASALYSNLITTRYTDGFLNGDLPYGWEKDKRDRVRNRYKKYDLDTYQPQYNMPRNRKSFNNHSLLDGINAKGIDINKADFIPGAIPSKSTDPRLQDPYQAFMLLDVNGSKQVYAPGLNDNDKCIVPNPRTNGEPEDLGHTRFTELKPYIVDFCFVDLSDSDNLAVRKDYKSEKDELLNKGVERYSKKDMKDNPEADIDSSGYSNPNKSRYKEFTDKLPLDVKADNFLNKIEHAQDLFQRTLKEISKIDFSNLIVSEQDYDDSIIREIKTNIKACRDQLGYAKNYAEESKTYDWYYDYAQKAYKYFEGYFDNLKDLMKKVDGMEDIEWYE